MPAISSDSTISGYSIFVDQSRTGTWRCDLWGWTGNHHMVRRAGRRYFKCRFDADECADIWREKYNVGAQDMYWPRRQTEEDWR